MLGVRVSVFRVRVRVGIKVNFKVSVNMRLDMI